jgi:peroxiredoxin
MIILAYVLTIGIILFLLLQWLLAQQLKHKQKIESHNYPSFEQTIQMAKTDADKSLSDLEPYVIVFLRHFGCTFCKEMLADFSKYGAQLKEENGIELVFVHMIDQTTARAHIKQYNLDDAHLISDTKREIYKSFGLSLGRFYQLFSMRVWLRGIILSLVKGHSLIGKQAGEAFQMPGVFYINKGEVLASFQPEYASERFNVASFLADIKE